MCEGIFCTFHTAIPNSNTCNLIFAKTDQHPRAHKHNPLNRFHSGLSTIRSGSFRFSRLQSLIFIFWYTGGVRCFCIFFWLLESVADQLVREALHCVRFSQCKTLQGCFSVKMVQVSKHARAWCLLAIVVLPYLNERDGVFQQLFEILLLTHPSLQVPSNAVS